MVPIRPAQAGAGKPTHCNLNDANGKASAVAGCVRASALLQRPSGLWYGSHEVMNTARWRELGRATTSNPPDSDTVRPPTATPYLHQCHDQHLPCVLWSRGGKGVCFAFASQDRPVPQRRACLTLDAGPTHVRTCGSGGAVLVWLIWEARLNIRSPEVARWRLPSAPALSPPALAGRCGAPKPKRCITVHDSGPLLPVSIRLVPHVSPGRHLESRPSPTRCRPRSFADSGTWLRVTNRPQGCA